MTLKYKMYRLLVLVTVMTILISGCARNNDSGGIFPTEPSSIVIGSAEKSVELKPDDPDFDTMMDYLHDRVEKSHAFDYILLATYDPDLEDTLPNIMKKTETYVELVYQEDVSQKIPMIRAGRVIENESISTKYIFFPLTGEYHTCFFVGRDSDYTDSSALDALVDNTELIRFIQQTVNK